MAMQKNRKTPSKRDVYRLTPRMLQRLKSDLRKFHDLFHWSRCSSAQLEALVVSAIKSDTQAQHHVRQREAGRDDLADITVQTNGEAHPMQIKSGKIQDQELILSGHGLGLLDGAMDKIAGFLNAARAGILAVSYRRVDGDMGRRHIYQICYIDKAIMAGLDVNDWTRHIVRHGVQFMQTNAAGVNLSLRPSRDCQIRWSFPCSQIEATNEFVIG